MKPELASKAEEVYHQCLYGANLSQVVAILRRNFSLEQLQETIAPMLSATNRALFPDAKLEVSTQKKITKVEQMIALLKDHYTQAELDSLVIPKLLGQSVVITEPEIDPEPL